MNASAPSDRLGRLGAFIRAQRRLAELSQRELAKVADVSDAYVSQLERGLHEPTVKVLQALAEALDVNARTMMRHAGWFEAGDDPTPDTVDTTAAIRDDPRLSAAQKRALLAVYRSFVDGAPDR